VAVAISQALELIKKKYEIEKLRLEIEEKKIDNESAKRLKEREKSVVDEGLDQITGVLAKLYEGNDEGRRNELRIAIRNTAGFLLIQIQRGVVFEVVGSPKTSEGKKVEEVEKGEGPSAIEARNLVLVQKFGGTMQAIVAKRDQLALLSGHEDEDS
jgi:hypothetical protein